MTQFNFYTRRMVDPKTSIDLYRWCSENHIPNPIPYDQLHCSVITAQEENPGYRLNRAPITIRPKDCAVKMLKEALTIVFDNSRLLQSWQAATVTGMSLKYPNYIGHISVSYAVPYNFDVSNVKPPTFSIRLLPEETAPATLVKCEFSSTVC